MSSDPRILLLGFAPWVDEARGLAVVENPSQLAVQRAASLLADAGVAACARAVEVSDEGVLAAVAEADRLEADVVVALGQTPTEPRVERFGRVPSRLRPAQEGECSPWLLASDADELAALLDSHVDDTAGLEPWRVSEDAGAYFCDHLCVELARLSRRSGATTRFLHVTAIDGCPPDVREARIALYARQVAVLAGHLASGGRRTA
jgi:pyrrolidone-carboxylate peptidase